MHDTLRINSTFSRVLASVAATEKERDQVNQGISDLVPGNQVPSGLKVLPGKYMYIQVLPCNIRYFQVFLENLASEKPVDPTANDGFHDSTLTVAS